MAWIQYDPNPVAIDGGAKEEFLDNLYDMMETAPNEKIRERFQKMIQEIEMEQ